jgi:hypothetical protein
MALKQVFDISEIILEILLTYLILSEAISYQRPLADAAISLSGQHYDGYFMVYPRPSRQALIARL